jgi:hypothetical protein
VVKKVSMVVLFALAILAVPSTASAAVEIIFISFDPAGRDAGSNDEYICLKNSGRAPVDLTGWSVEDQDGNVYTFGEYSLPSKDVVTIYTGSGDDRRLHKYWDLDAAVWDDDGETATARGASGRVVD